jgi:hypothetical protein
MPEIRSIRSTATLESIGFNGCPAKEDSAIKIAIAPLGAIAISF